MITASSGDGLRREKKLSKRSVAERVYNKLKYGNFSETLTLDEADKLQTFETFGDPHEAYEFARRVNGVVHTQVDWDAPYPDDIGYERGFHMVNRTGVYAVAW
jgi:hypothetical protein